MSGNVMLLMLVIFPMLSAIISYIFGRYSKKLRNIAVCGAVIIEFVMMMYCAWLFSAGDPVEYVLEDFCARGLELRLDGFRVIYGIIVAVMWLMSSLFSMQYFKHYRNRNRYYFFLLMTLGATMGVFLSADLYTTFMFFEIMSFTSYVWVAHDEKSSSLRAAQTYLAVAVIGGLVMLMGLFMLNAYAGTLRISELYDAVQTASISGAYGRGWLYVSGALLLFGFGAKAGMFPLHIWLPKAHPVAPAPASALLSGILTKSGVFGILVISCEIFRHDRAWGNVVLLIGIITMFIGALLALFSVDLKRTLACSSMSQIGFILTGVGMQCLLGRENGIAAGGTLLHMVNHSLIKLVLFMAAGVIYMNLHKLNLNDIRGFGRRRPVLKMVLLVGALSIGGVPLFSGYVSKTLLHESIVEYVEVLARAGQSTFLYNAAEWIFLLTGGMTIAYMLKLFIAIFVEKGKFEEKGACMNRLSGFALAVPAAILFVMGLMPGLTMDRIAGLGQSFMSSEEFAGAPYFSFNNLKGALISMTIGALLYAFFVRRVLMVHHRDGSSEYVNRWSEKLDIENLIYRPMLERVLPGVLGEVCRFVGDVLPRRLWALILAVGGKIAQVLDIIPAGSISLASRTIFKPRIERKKPGMRRRAYEKYEGYESTARIIMASMAFGMLMICIGLCFTLIYLLSLLV